MDYRSDIDRAELLKIIGRYDALVFRSRTIVDRELIERGRNLKILLRVGRGLDNVDLDLAEKSGIKVYNTPEAPVNSTAELTIALIIMCARNLYSLTNSMKRGEWRRDLGVELYGKNLCIIGLGRIGSRVAEIARGLGMKIYAYDIRDVRSKAERLGVSLAGSIEELLPICDVVTLHVDLNSRSEKIINERTLGMVKDGCIIVNTSRGRVIDPKALLKYIDTEKIRCVAMDVYSVEPPPEGSDEYTLIKHPKVIATPHIGFQTVEAQRKAALEAVEILVRELGKR